MAQVDNGQQPQQEPAILAVPDQVPPHKPEADDHEGVADPLNPPPPSLTTPDAGRTEQRIRNESQQTGGINTQELILKKHTVS